MLTFVQPCLTLNIRVLLAKIERPKPGRGSRYKLSIELPGGGLVRESPTSHTDAPQSKQCLPASCTIWYTPDGVLHVPSVSRTGRYRALALESASGTCGYDGTQYSGSLRLVSQGDDLLVINVVDLEEYVASVLRWESWPGWPKEVNKAFAVMCRTYAVDKMHKARKKRKPYDVLATNMHQTYKGIHTHAMLYDAVRETEGHVLTYNGLFIDAMFDSCCGGIEPEKLSAIDIRRHPYFKRERCTFCKRCTLYEWSYTYSVDEFHALLAQEYKKPVRIKRIDRVEYDDAGAVRAVVFCTTAGKRLALSGADMYRIGKRIKSKAYTVSWSSEGLQLKGSGLGHHIGLCQWGAYYAHKDKGWSYTRILSFYYPGTVIMKVKESQ